MSHPVQFLKNHMPHLPHTYKYSKSNEHWLNVMPAMVDCWGPASAESRGYPQDEQCWQERERRHVRPALIGPSLREGERERENDQTGVFAGSWRVWPCFIFYRGFYTLN